jgi:hypothetical protein
MLKTRTSFFGTVNERAIPATLRTLIPPLRCKPRPWPAVGDFHLSSRYVGPDHLAFSATKFRDGTVREQFSAYRYADTGDTLVTHALEVRAASSAFTVSPDLSSARVEGAAPFSRGSATFAATGPSSVASPGRNGDLTGNLEAAFDSIGKVELFSSGRISAFLGSCRAGCVVAG